MLNADKSTSNCFIEIFSSIFSDSSRVAGSGVASGNLAHCPNLLFPQVRTKLLKVSNRMCSAPHAIFLMPSFENSAGMCLKCKLEGITPYANTI